MAPSCCFVIEVGIRAARAGGMTVLGIARHDDAAQLRAEGTNLVGRSGGRRTGKRAPLLSPALTETSE